MIGNGNKIENYDRKKFIYYLKEDNNNAGSKKETTKAESPYEEGQSPLYNATQSHHVKSGGIPRRVSVDTCTPQHTADDGSEESREGYSTLCQSVGQTYDIGRRHDILDLSTSFGWDLQSIP